MFLVIDDEVDVCELMADYLEAQGKQVTKAFNVPEALKAIKQGQFSFVVCDLVIGTGKGESILNYLRKEGSGHEKTPCLLVSGKKTPEEVTLGAYERFLSKPFSEEEFLSEIEKTISQNTVAAPKTEVAKMHPDLKKLIGS